MDNKILPGLLAGRTAVVTGATRGVGRGIAHELARAGANVYVTGRSVPLDRERDGRITILHCDHSDDTEVDRTFDIIFGETQEIDILVNSVWGGYENMVEAGEFTWPKPFWDQPLWRWDSMFGGGVRAHYRASQLVARQMVSQRRGLIVNISHWAAQKYIGNVAYGVAKAATDKMTGDMAHELAEYGVAVVVLYPGMVRTEKVMESAQWLDLSNSESPEFSGRAVVALANDTDVLRHSGKIRVVADLAREYGFTDMDGTRPRPLTLGDV
jgi:NAD(P)-dependent dehydrogenase (short-subunit alcohol dehydrogenase family)